MKPQWTNCVGLLLLLSIFHCKIAHSAELPNVVVIFIDDMGYADIGPFGANAFPTPNLDRMAHEGRRFTDFHVSSAVCSASRSALLTGCYHERVGFSGALGPSANIGLSSNEMTLRRATDWNIPTRCVSEGRFRRSLTYVSG